MEIKQGPNKGYFFLPSRFVNDGSIVRNNQVYSRFKLGGDKRIHGFNSSYLPFVDGYYYIPKNTQIDTRKLTYALENKLMPSSGNTEVFNTNFENIVVPDEYCPYYLKPCIYDWCKRCEEMKRGKSVSVDYSNPKLTAEQLENRNNIIWSFSFILAVVLFIALLS